MVLEIEVFAPRAFACLKFKTELSSEFPGHSAVTYCRRRLLPHPLLDHLLPRHQREAHAVVVRHGVAPVDADHARWLSVGHGRCSKPASAAMSFSASASSRPRSVASKVRARTTRCSAKPCPARKLPATLSAEDYSTAQHVIVSSDGNDTTGLDDFLNAAGIARAVIAGVSRYSAVSRTRVAGGARDCDGARDCGALHGTAIRPQGMRPTSRFPGRVDIDALSPGRSCGRTLDLVSTAVCRCCVERAGGINLPDESTCSGRIADLTGETKIHRGARRAHSAGSGGESTIDARRSARYRGRFEIPAEPRDHRSHLVGAHVSFYGHDAMHRRV